MGKTDSIVRIRKRRVRNKQRELYYQTLGFLSNEETARLLGSMMSARSHLKSIRRVHPARCAR